MTYPYDPDTALSLFHTDHQQRMNEADAQRRAEPGRNSARAGRRWATVAVTVAVAVFATAAIPVNNASTDPRPVAISNCDLGGNYRTGCQLVAGRPDGWYDTTQPSTVPVTSTASGSLKYK